MFAAVPVNFKAFSWTASLLLIASLLFPPVIRTFVTYELFLDGSTRAKETEHSELGWVGAWDAVANKRVVVLKILALEWAAALAGALLLAFIGRRKNFGYWRALFLLVFLLFFQLTLAPRSVVRQESNPRSPLGYITVKEVKLGPVWQIDPDAEEFLLGWLALGCGVISMLSGLAGITSPNQAHTNAPQPEATTVTSECAMCGKELSDGGR